MTARLGGQLKSLLSTQAGNDTVSHAQKIVPLQETIKMTQANTTKWGGARKGAGRPAGSRNKPHLIDGLPVTQNPLQWLLALMNSTHAPMQLRIDAARALMSYFHARPG